MKKNNLEEMGFLNNSLLGITLLNEHINSFLNFEKIKKLLCPNYSSLSEKDKLNFQKDIDKIILKYQKKIEKIEMKRKLKIEKEVEKKFLLLEKNKQTKNKIM